MSKLQKYRFVREFPTGDVVIPTILGGHFGKDVVEEFKNRIKTDFRGNKVLTGDESSLDYFHVVELNKEWTVQDFNVYSLVLINQMLRQVGLRTANQAEIERLLTSRELDLEHVIVCSSLVLRSGEDPNSYLARDLIKQLGDIELPVMIPLHQLDLRVDDQAPHGLAFDIRQDTEPVHAPVLNSPFGYFYFNEGFVNTATGLPSKVEVPKKENRPTLWNSHLIKGDRPPLNMRSYSTRNSGLCSLSTIDVWHLNSSNPDLAGTGSVTRTIITD